MNRATGSTAFAMQINEMAQEINKLRADLAAERKRAEKWERIAWEADSTRLCAALAALKMARVALKPFAEEGEWDNDHGCESATFCRSDLKKAANALAQIDAVLGDGDE